jgi:hypothetical protein
MAAVTSTYKNLSHSVPMQRRRVFGVSPEATTPFFVVLKDIQNRQMVMDWPVFEGKREVGMKLDRGIHDVDDVDDGRNRGRSDDGGRSDCDDRNSGGRDFRPQLRLSQTYTLDIEVRSEWAEKKERG